ncbi:MAG: ABC transporter permease [Ktedonobacteraceae bacterium]
MSQETMKTPEKGRDQSGSHEREQKAIAVSSGGASAQHTVRNIGLIIAREYKNRVTQRSFLISSIILLAIVFIAAFVPTIIQFIEARTTSQTHVVVVNKAGTIAGLNETMLLSYINSELNGTNTSSKAPYAISSQPSADLGSLQNQVKNGKLDILLVLARTTNQDLGFTYYTNASSTSDTNLPKIQALAQQLNFLVVAHRLGLTPSQTRSLFTAPGFTVVNTGQSNRPVNEIVAGYTLAFAGAVLIYISLAIYASGVAMGVAEEKSSRIMEILVNAATPLQLMVGKVVGIGAACLTQMACLVAVGIGALLLQTPLQAALFGSNAGGFIQYLTGVSIPFYLLFLVYFTLGFFLYATLYAGLGALVKRQDEVQSAVQVPSMLIAGAWLLTYLAAGFPDATYTKVLSYIPFFTPTMMLARFAPGTVAWWEIVMTIALMLLAIYACTVFAARLYRLGVLMYGQKPGLGQLMRMARMR